MMIRPYCKTDREQWLRLRLKLWPFLAADEHLPDMDAWLARPDTIVLVAPRTASPGLAGFAEVGTRSTAEWCETSPVAYLEGWYVEADARRQGIGAALVLAAENWAREHGFREFASDTQIVSRSDVLPQRPRREGQRDRRAVIPRPLTGALSTVSKACNLARPAGRPPARENSVPIV